MHDCQETSESIGGRPVRVASYREKGRYRAAAAWRDLSPGTHLNLGGTGRSKAARDRLLTIIRSVRFKRKS